jgi:hypothetical protein
MLYYFSSSLISAEALNPFITGIIRSIRIISNILPSLRNLSTMSTAYWPSKAHSKSTPTAKIYAWIAICINLLSSTTNMICFPLSSSELEGISTCWAIPTRICLDLTALARESF